VWDVSSDQFHPYDNGYYSKGSAEDKPTGKL